MAVTVAAVAVDCGGAAADDDDVAGFEGAAAAAVVAAEATVLVWEEAQQSEQPARRPRRRGHCTRDGVINVRQVSIELRKGNTSCRSDSLLKQSTRHSAVRHSSNNEDKRTLSQLEGWKAPGCSETPLTLPASDCCRFHCHANEYHCCHS